MNGGVDRVLYTPKIATEVGGTYPTEMHTFVQNFSQCHFHDNRYVQPFDRQVAIVFKIHGSLLCLSSRSWQVSH